MKKLYMIGGTMGVGKTTTCMLLRDMLPNCAFLDGDWCWSMHPFQVTEETKRMVVENIAYLLNSFLRCSAFENVVFCWVMHEQSIIDDILSRLEGEFEPVCVSLVSRSRRCGRDWRRMLLRDCERRTSSNAVRREFHCMIS